MNARLHPYKIEVRRVLNLGHGNYSLPLAFILPLYPLILLILCQVHHLLHEGIILSSILSLKSFFSPIYIDGHTYMISIPHAAALLFARTSCNRLFFCLFFLLLAGFFSVKQSRDESTIHNYEWLHIL